MTIMRALQFNMNKSIINIMKKKNMILKIRSCNKKKIHQSRCDLFLIIIDQRNSTLILMKMIRNNLMISLDRMMRKKEKMRKRRNLRGKN